MIFDMKPTRQICSSSGCESIYVLIAIILLISAFGTGCSGSRETTNRSDLARQFDTFFGFEPPSSVTDLHAKSVTVGDTIVDWLSFKCGSDVLERIVASDNYKILSQENSLHSLQTQVPNIDSPNPNAPHWWPKTPATVNSRIYYLSRPYVVGETPARSSVTYFWRDERTGTVFAYYSAWH